LNHGGLHTISSVWMKEKNFICLFSFFFGVKLDWKSRSTNDINNECIYNLSRKSWESDTASKARSKRENSIKINH
jgi:hypothetical protein